MTRLTRFGFVGAALAVAVSVPVAAQQQRPAATTGSNTASATATLIDAQNRTVGRAMLRETAKGLLVQLDLDSVTPGVHALHIHQTGRCEAPSFESAGDHYNPGRHEHGVLNPRGPHAGDLPNIDVPASAQLKAEFFLPELTLRAGERSLLDNDGSAIVLHAGKDDYASDPAGNAGDRLACGPIVSAAAG